MKGESEPLHSLRESVREKEADTEAQEPLCPTVCSAQQPRPASALVSEHQPGDKASHPWEPPTCCHRAGRATRREPLLGAPGGLPKRRSPGSGAALRAQGPGGGSPHSTRSSS